MTLTDITGLWWVKPLVIVAALAVTHGGMYLWGYRNAQASGAAAVTTKIITQVKNMPGETKYVTQQQEVIRVKYVPIEKIIHEVSNAPDCDWSPDVIGMFNIARNLSALPDFDGKSTAASSDHP